MFHLACCNLGGFTYRVYFDLQKVKSSWQFDVYSFVGFFFFLFLNAASFQVQVLLPAVHN